MKAASIVLSLLIWSGIAACSLQTTPGAPVVTARASPAVTTSSAADLIALTPTATLIPTLEVSSTLVPSSTPTLVPLNLANPAVVVMANNLPGPDDLVLAPDGSIFISDIVDGTIRQLAPDGKLQVILTGLSIPEGLVILPDNSLLVAEQGKNRLVLCNLKTGSMTPFLTLINKTSNEGVDGIFLDDRPSLMPSIIIPDSPNGTVLRASLDGKTLVTIASGFARPTGGWVEPDGSLLVADENGGAIKRIHPDGKVEKLADFLVPDDVVEDPAGNIFVATLGDNAIHVIPAGREQNILLTSGLSGPQGIIFDPAGNLVVTDPGNHRLIKIMIHP